MTFEVERGGCNGAQVLFQQPQRRGCAAIITARVRHEFHEGWLLPETFDDGSREIPREGSRHVGPIERLTRPEFLEAFGIPERTMIASRCHRIAIVPARYRDLPFRADGDPFLEPERQFEMLLTNLLGRGR